MTIYMCTPGNFGLRREMDIRRMAVGLPWEREERGKRHLNGYIANSCSSTPGNVWVGIRGCGVDGATESPSSP